MAISRETVEHIARLAHIGLSRQEVDELTTELSSILAHVAQVQSVDTSGVESHGHIEHSAAPSRPDDVVPSWNSASVLVNAPHSTRDLFQVQAVLEEG